MNKLTEAQKQQYARLHEILLTGRQRYLEAGGDPRRCLSGRHGDDYLTNEERQEALELGQKLFGSINR
jgi:truncated hemoglobin YjbI